MWELGNGWADGRSSAQMASYHAMMHEIHVLLVDHDSEALINTAKLLEICQYRVTFVELASAAISMLLSGKAKFDAVIANINSPDLHGFKLLQHAANMGLPVVLMSVDDNAFMAMRALENGAFLYIKKPATIEILRCLWQHVLREKTRMIRERDMVVAANNNNNNNGHVNRGIEIVHNNNREENPDYYNVGRVSGHVMKSNKGKCKKKIRGMREGADDDDEGDSDNYRGTMENNNVKRKMCTEWTQELHAKFMNAVEQLGEGRCFPKEILELMNVPGLTRMQVASHLQKCRNDNWRSPLERKSHQINQPLPLDINASQQRPRRFGSKPQLGKIQSGQVHESQGTGQGSETHSDTETPRNDGHGNNGTGHHQQYGSSVVPDPTNVRPGTHSSANPNEYFNFPDVDSLLQNISGLPQGSAVNNPNPAPGAYNFDPAYNDQNSAGPSMDTKSNWSSETSNFEE